MAEIDCPLAHKNSPVLAVNQIVDKSKWSIQIDCELPSTTTAPATTALVPAPPPAQPLQTETEIIRHLKEMHKHSFTSPLQKAQSVVREAFILTDGM